MAVQVKEKVKWKFFVFLPSSLTSQAKEEGNISLNRGFFPQTWFILFCLISGECWKRKCIVSSPMSAVLNICWALNTSAKQSKSLSTPPNPAPPHPPFSLLLWIGLRGKIMCWACRLEENMSKNSLVAGVSYCQPQLNWGLRLALICVMHRNLDTELWNSFSRSIPKQLPVNSHLRGSTPMLFRKEKKGG